MSMKSANDDGVSRGFVYCMLFFVQHSFHLSFSFHVGANFDQRHGIRFSKKPNISCLKVLSS